MTYSIAYNRGGRDKNAPRLRLRLEGNTQMWDLHDGEIVDAPCSARLDKVTQGHVVSRWYDPGYEKDVTSSITEDLFVKNASNFHTIGNRLDEYVIEFPGGIREHIPRIKIFAIHGIVRKQRLKLTRNVTQEVQKSRRASSSHLDETLDNNKSFIMSMRGMEEDSPDDISKKSRTTILLPKKRNRLGRGMRGMERMISGSLQRMTEKTPSKKHIQEIEMNTAVNPMAADIPVVDITLTETSNTANPMAGITSHKQKLVPKEKLIPKQKLIPKEELIPKQKLIPKEKLIPRQKLIPKEKLIPKQRPQKYQSKKTLPYIQELNHMIVQVEEFRHIHEREGITQPREDSQERVIDSYDIDDPEDDISLAPERPNLTSAKSADPGKIEDIYDSFDDGHFSEDFVPSNPYQRDEEAGEEYGVYRSSRNDSFVGSPRNVSQDNTSGRN